MRPPARSSVASSGRRSSHSGRLAGARDDDTAGRTAAGLVTAMLLYHLAVVSILGYARIGLAMSGVGMGPAVVFHSAMAAWSVARLRIACRNPRGGTNGGGVLRR